MVEGGRRRELERLGLLDGEGEASGVSRLVEEGEADPGERRFSADVYLLLCGSGGTNDWCWCWCRM
jgi:hypothetical protein